MSETTDGGDFINLDELDKAANTFLTGFLYEINWQEPWIIGLCAFHVISTLIIIFTRNTTVQVVTFLTLCAIGLVAEQLNELGALYWDRFSTQQYFDSSGFFVSTMLCFPILMNLTLLTAMGVYTAGQMLIKVKRAQNRSRAREAAGDKNADTKKDK